VRHDLSKRARAFQHRERLRQERTRRLWKRGNSCARRGYPAPRFARLPATNEPAGPAADDDTSNVCATPRPWTLRRSLQRATPLSPFRTREVGTTRTSVGTMYMAVARRVRAQFVDVDRGAGARRDVGFEDLAEATGDDARNRGVGEGRMRRQRRSTSPARRGTRAPSACRRCGRGTKAGRRRRGSRVSGQEGTGRVHRRRPSAGAGTPSDVAREHRRSARGEFAVDDLDVRIRTRHADRDAVVAGFAVAQDVEDRDVGLRRTEEVREDAPGSAARSSRRLLTGNASPAKSTVRSETKGGIGAVRSRT